MVTDKMLQQAAGEVELAMLNALSVQDVEPHRFSRQFERKMKKLTSRVKHPVRYNALRSAAAIILIIFTLFGALVAFSPEVRASVVEWAKETFWGSAQYVASGNAEASQYDYQLSVIPDGYRELHTIEAEDGRNYLYVNDSGNLLKFIYSYGTMVSKLFIQTEFHTKVEGTVNGAAADIYITSNENESNVIVWCDPETKTLLCIHAFTDKDMLIAMAESVTKTKK